MSKELLPGMLQQRGFSLLEVLVAFSILALSMGVLLQIFSGGLRNVGLSEDYARAAAIAETQLAGAGIEVPLVPGEARGEFEEKFRWHFVAQPLDADLASGQTQPPGQSIVSPVGLMGLAVTVEWGGVAENARTLTLYSARVYTKTP